MNDLPGALFVVDPKNEAIAVREGRRLGIPIIADDWEFRLLLL